MCILSNVYSKLCISWKALESPDNRERAEVMWQDFLAHRSTGGVCKHETATGSGSNVGPPCAWKAFYTDGRRKTWIYEFSAFANPWGQIKTSRIFFNKAWCSGSRLATLPESCGGCGAGCTGFKGICGVFWFDFDGPTRSLHDFARAENVTFINSPMAEVSHDLAWHAKCNGEKMHNFESCHTSPYRGGWGGTPLLSISVGTGVYTTSSPVGHTFRELWQCPLCGWVGVQRSTNRLE